MGVARMDDGGRRCALTGCDRVIPRTEGRPERRYCTAAHRAAARQARRAAMQAEPRDAARLAETLPWLREPADGPVPARRVVEVLDPDAAVPEPSARPSRDRRAPRPRGRALAMLGVAGILAGGYAATDARPEPSPSVSTTPEGETADAWAQRAAVALTSVNGELDVLDQAEQEWQRMPERPATVPAPVAALEERRSVLQQRRATLQSQLDAYRSLRRAQQDLAVSEQHLRAVEKALADAPPQRRRSSEQEAAIAALDEQRDLRIRQRDAQQAELDSLQEGMATATRTPLPDDGAVTTEVSRDVHEMVRNGGTTPTRPAAPGPPRPDVVPGREEDGGKPRQEVGTSGPPDPRGPRDESEERRRAVAERDRAASPERDEPDAGTVVPRTDAAPEPGPGPGPAPGPAGSTPEPGTPDGRATDAVPDVLAELRERAKEVAREARKAEAARRTGATGTRTDAQGPTVAGQVGVGITDGGTPRPSERARRADATSDPVKPSPRPRASRADRDLVPVEERTGSADQPEQKAERRAAPSADHRRPDRDGDAANREEKRDSAAERGEKRDDEARTRTKRHDADEDRAGAPSDVQERHRGARTADRVAQAQDVVVYVIPHWPIRETSAEQARDEQASEPRPGQKRSGKRKQAQRRSSERKPGAKTDGSAKKDAEKAAEKDEDTKPSGRRPADEDRSDGERHTSGDSTKRSGRHGSSDRHGSGADDG